MAVFIAVLASIIAVVIGVLGNWIKKPDSISRKQVIITLIALVAVQIGCVVSLLPEGSSPGGGRLQGLGSPEINHDDVLPLRVPSEVDVSAVNGGFDSGITLRRGDSVEVGASGSIQYGYEGGEFGDCKGFATVDPDGNRTVGGVSCVPKKDGNEPLPDAPVGSLVARVGDGAWFLVGSKKTFQADEDGRLWLAANDFTREDNKGSYGVTVRVGK